MKLLRAALLLFLFPLLVTGCKVKDDAGVPASDAGPPPIPPPRRRRCRRRRQNRVRPRVEGDHGRPAAPIRAEVGATIHHTGWTTDGKMFESTYQRDPVNLRRR
jgi:hypothetical protein